MWLEIANPSCKSMEKPFFALLSAIDRLNKIITALDTKLCLFLLHDFRGKKYP